MKRRQLEIYDDARIVAERHREKGYEEGAAQERAKIVAHLRFGLDDWPDYVAPADIADAIEAKEHLK
jgi:hypothetical protein